MSDLKSLRDYGVVKQFAKNHIVFRENEAGEDMYIVLSGTFGVYINSFNDFPMRVAEVVSGSFFGEMSVIDYFPRSATVTAEENSAALAVDKTNFARLLQNNPDLTGRVVEALYGRAAGVAAQVQAAGKQPLTLPGQGVPPNIDGVLAHLTVLTRLIRQMNAMLLPSDTAEPIAAPAPRPSGAGVLRLLPDGHPVFNAEDGDGAAMLYAQATTCPYCQREVKAQLPSFPALEKERALLDGRVIYRGFNILLYTNIVCPHCNFADVHSEFLSGRGPSLSPRYKTNQFVNRERFTGFAQPGRHTTDEAILSCYLNLEGLKRVTRDPLRFAKAWHRLYWLYSDNNRDAATDLLCKTAAFKAYYFYNKYAGKNDSVMTRDEKIRLNALLGELAIALDDYDQAREYFEKIAVAGRWVSSNEVVRESQKRCEEIKYL